MRVALQRVQSCWLLLTLANQISTSNTSSQVLLVRANTYSLYCLLSPRSKIARLVPFSVEDVSPAKVEVDSHHVLGVMLALRHLIPRLMPVVTQARHSTLTNKAQPSPDVSTITLDSVLQIFELLLHYLDHKDHNVVTSSLETLQQFLKSASPIVVRRLSRKGSFAHSTFKGQALRARAESRSHTVDQ